MMKKIKYEVYWNGTERTVLIAPWKVIQQVAQEIEEYNEEVDEHQDENKTTE